MEYEGLAMHGGSAQPMNNEA